MKQIESILLLCISMAYAGRGGGPLEIHGHIFEYPEYTFRDVAREVSGLVPINLDHILSKQGPVTYKNWYEVSMILCLADAPEFASVKNKFDYLLNLEAMLRTHLDPNLRLEDPTKRRILEEKCVRDGIIPTENQTNTEILKENFPWFGKVPGAKNGKMEPIGLLEDVGESKFPLHSILGVLLNICWAIQEPEMILLNSLYYEANEDRSVPKLTQILELCKSIQNPSPGFKEIINLFEDIIKRSEQGMDRWLDADSELDDLCSGLEGQMNVYRNAFKLKDQFLQHLRDIKKLPWILHEKWGEVHNLICELEKVFAPFKDQNISAKLDNFAVRINYATAQWADLNKSKVPGIEINLYNLDKIRQNLLHCYRMLGLFVPVGVERTQNTLDSLRSCQELSDALSLFEGNNSLLKNYFDGKDVKTMSTKDLLDSSKELFDIATAIEDKTKKSPQLKGIIKFSGMNASEYLSNVAWFYESATKLNAFEEDIGNLRAEQKLVMLNIALESDAKYHKFNSIVNRSITGIVIRDMIKRALKAGQTDITDDICSDEMLEKMDKVINKPEESISQHCSLSVQLEEAPAEVKPEPAPRQPEPKKTARRVASRRTQSIPPTVLRSSSRVDYQRAPKEELGFGKSEESISQDCSLSVQLEEAPAEVKPEPAPRQPEPKKTARRTSRGGAASRRALSIPSTVLRSSSRVDYQGIAEEEPAPLEEASVEAKPEQTPAKRKRIKSAYLAGLALKTLYNLGNETAEINSYPKLCDNFKPIGEAISGAVFTLVDYYRECPPGGALADAFRREGAIQSTGTNSHSKDVAVLNAKGGVLVTGSANFNDPSQRSSKTDIMATCQSNYAFKMKMRGLVHRICADVATSQQKDQYIAELCSLIMPRWIESMTIDQNTDMVNDAKNFICMNLEKILGKEGLSINALTNSILDFIEDSVLQVIPDDHTSKVTVHFLGARNRADSDPITCKNIASFYDFHNWDLQGNESMVCFMCTVPDPTKPTSNHLLNKIIANIKGAKKVYFTSTSAPRKELIDALEQCKAHVKIEVRGGNYEGTDPKILRFIEMACQCPGQHSKSIMIEEEDGTIYLYLGSNNFSFAGFENNSESMLMIKTKDRELAEKYRKWFDEIKSK